MNTFKISTTTGFVNYIGTSLTPDEYVKQSLGFDYDEFNKLLSPKPKWDKSSGVINSIELFYCGNRDKQVREKLV